MTGLAYHVLLLSESALIVVSEDEKGKPRPIRLMWRDHEYLDKAGESFVDDNASMYIENESDRISGHARMVGCNACNCDIKKV